MTDPWDDGAYPWKDTRDVTTLPTPVCKECGAVIGDRPVHERWHVEFPVKPTWVHEAEAE